MKVIVKLEYDVEVNDLHHPTIEDLREYVEDEPGWIIDNCYTDGHHRIEIVEVK